MIGAEASKIVNDNSRAVVRAATEAGFKSLKHAAFSIAKSARGSMVRAKGPSPAGQPPHVHRGRLRRSIRVGEEAGEYVVGSSYTQMQAGDYPPWMARMHEQGGTFGVNARTGLTSLTKLGKRRKAAVYPARPFMLPALQRAVARFNESFGGGAGG